MCLLLHPSWDKYSLVLGPWRSRFVKSNTLPSINSQGVASVLWCEELTWDTIQYLSHLIARHYSIPVPFDWETLFSTCTIRLRDTIQYLSHLTEKHFSVPVPFDWDTIQYTSHHNSVPVLVADKVDLPRSFLYTVNTVSGSDTGDLTSITHWFTYTNTYIHRHTTPTSTHIKGLLIKTRYDLSPPSNKLKVNNKEVMEEKSNTDV